MTVDAMDVGVDKGTVVARIRSDGELRMLKAENVDGVWRWTYADAQGCEIDGGVAVTRGQAVLMAERARADDEIYETGGLVDAALADGGVIDAIRFVEGWHRVFAPRLIDSGVAGERYFMVHRNRRHGVGRESDMVMIGQADSDIGSMYERGGTAAERYVDFGRGFRWVGGEKPLLAVDEDPDVDQLDSLERELELKRLSELEAYILAMPDDDPEPWNRLLAKMESIGCKLADWMVLRAAFLQRNRNLVYRRYRRPPFEVLVPPDEAEAAETA